MLKKTRKLRIALLLIILFVVTLNTWLSKIRTTDWDSPLWVSIHPINGDGSSNTARYIESLTAADFDDVETFFSEEARHYGLALEQPVEIKLAEEVDALPPQAPVGGGAFDVIIWSLKLRYWAWQHDNYDGPANMQMYVVFHDPEITPHVAHSTALQKGLVSVVNAFAERKMRRDNNVIIAHEFLHMVGATDKYDMRNNMPLYPDGYAEPEKTPLYPQKSAELMGGRIPISEDKAAAPQQLGQVLIGETTAREINWLKSD